MNAHPDGGVPDFFYYHFDLAAAADVPAPESDGAVPCGPTWS